MQLRNDIEPKQLRPVIYLRVSTEDQVEKYGLQLQQHAIENFIKGKYNIDPSDIKIYRDEAKSWTLAIKDRPWLKALFEDIKYSPTWEAPFDVVVVYKIDRFARDLRVLLDIVSELKKNWVDFASTQEMIDTSTPFWKAMLGILWVFAELDRDMIIEKTHAGIDRALLDGVWYKDKFGYKKDKNKRPTIHKEQAEIIKKMFYMFWELKYPVSKIVQIFTQEKILIPTARSSERFASRPVKNVYWWTDKTIRKILADEVYIGEYYYNKQETIVDKISGGKTIKELPKEQWQLSPIKHVPIIDNETFEKVQLLLVEKKWNFQKSKNSYLLWGLLKCDYCKWDKVRGMVSWTGISSNWSKYYQCSWKNTQKHQHTCCTIPLPKEELEAIVKAEIKEIILNPDAIKKYNNKAKNHQESQTIIQNDIRKLDNLLRNLYENIVSLEEAFTNWTSSLSTQEYITTKKKLSDNISLKQEERAILERKLSKSIEAEKQILAMNYVQQLLWNLEDVFADEEKCKELFSILIENIVVYSEIDASIKATWRKKKWSKKQAFPKGIVVNFKLPQQFLNDVFLNEWLKETLKQ